MWEPFKDSPSGVRVRFAEREQWAPRHRGGVTTVEQSQLPSEAHYEALVEEFVGVEGVTLPGDGLGAKRGFGADALKVHGKIFAMLAGGRLVVKLPRQRVDALIASGDGARFDPRKDGRLMAEWLSLEPTSTTEWLALAREAMAYVGKL
jgi:hypothetical protein